MNDEETEWEPLFNDEEEKAYTEILTLSGTSMTVEKAYTAAHNNTGRNILGKYIEEGLGELPLTILVVESEDTGLSRFQEKIMAQRYERAMRWTDEDAAALKRFREEKQNG
jgi:hypothetical protein